MALVRGQREALNLLVSRATRCGVLTTARRRGRLPGAVGLPTGAGPGAPGGGQRLTVGASRLTGELTTATAGVTARLALTHRQTPTRGSAHD